MASVRRAWIGTVSCNALTLLFGICTGILAARILGPEDRGLLAAVLFWPSLIASIGFMSLGEAIVLRASQPDARSRCLPSTVAALSVLLGVPVATAGALLLPSLLGEERESVQVLGQIYLAAFIPVNFLSLALIAIDHGERNFLFYNVLRSIPSGIYLLGLLLLYFLDSFTIATAVCASWFGTCMIVIAKVASRWRVFTTLPSLQESFAVLRQGFCFHGATLITIATTQMDRAAAMFILSDEELGLYAVAFTFASAGLSVVAHSVPTVLLPSLAGQADRAVALEQLQEGLRRTLNVLLLASAAAMGAIPAVLPILFGENFRSAVPVAVALVGAFLPLALRQVALRSLRAFRDGKTGLAVETVAFGSFALLVAPATACFGMRGLAVAYACSNVIALAALAHRMKRIYGLTYKAWFSNRSEVMADFRLIIGLARHRCG